MIPTFDPLNPVASRFTPHDDVGNPNDIKRSDKFHGEQLTFAKICTVNNKPAARWDRCNQMTRGNKSEPEFHFRDIRLRWTRTVDADADRRHSLSGGSTNSNYFSLRDDKSND